MVGDRKTTGSEYTVGALLLQAAVLLGYAAIFYFESQASTYGLTAGIGNGMAFFFGGLGAIAVWLAGEHYSENVRSSRLQLWAISFIILSLAPLISFTLMFIFYYSFISLVYLLPVLLFFIASIMVLTFSRRECSTRQDLNEW